MRAPLIVNLSYRLDVQSGPTVVLVGAALFAVVFIPTGPLGPETRAPARAGSG